MVSDGLSKRKKAITLLSMKGHGRDSKAQISRYLDDKLTIVVLANLDEADPETIADHVAEIYLSGTAAGLSDSK